MGMCGVDRFETDERERSPRLSLAQLMYKSLGGCRISTCSGRGVGRGLNRRLIVASIGGMLIWGDVSIWRTLFADRVSFQDTLER
jgi:hypothetical protein